MLHNVTDGKMPMKNPLIKVLGAAAVVLTVASCAGKSAAPEDNKVEVEELVFAMNPEPLKGKADVYTSMARAAKYNVDAAAQNMNKRIFNQNPNLTPRDIIRNVLNVKAGPENPLYDSMRILDFSVIYAISALSGNPAYNENNFYAKSAQNLALAAIQAHKNTLFAEKKIKEIKRVTDREQKILKELKAKEGRNGGLSASETEYKKNLEVVLLKLNELKNALIFNEVEYAGLVKVEDKDIKLEGRRFYELEDFDRKTGLKLFQNAAVRNRNEFAIAKDFGVFYDYAAVEHNAGLKYPEISRLEVNGLDINNPRYADKLEQRAEKIAESLVDKAAAYRRSNKPEEKQKRRKEAFDELGIAIFAQIEVAYNIVLLADLDNENIMRQLKVYDKELRELQKQRQDYKNKIAVLNKQLEIFSLQLRQSQIIAERAVALRSLYFYAGFSPFTRTLLKGTIKDIETTLKQGFNQDMVEMLAAVKRAPQPEKAAVKNDWAKQDNWLEKLVDGKTAAVSADRSVRPAAAYSPAYDNYKIMQLGAYSERVNAEKDWQSLSSRYSGLKAHRPHIEAVKSGNKVLYRLQVRNAQGGLAGLCNEIRRGGDDCILK